MSIARSSYLKNTTGGDFLDQKQGGTILGQSADTDTTNSLTLKDSAVSQDINLKQNSTTTKIISGGEFGRMRRGKYIIKGATSEIAALQSFILSFLGRFADVFKNLSSRDTIAIIVIPDAPPPVCRFTIRVTDPAGSGTGTQQQYISVTSLNPAITGTVATDDDFDFVIDWGDGSPTKTIQSIADFDAGGLSPDRLLLPYTQAGTYNVTFTGKCDKMGLAMPHQPTRIPRGALVSIEEWGGFKIDSYFYSAFAGGNTNYSFSSTYVYGDPQTVFTTLPQDAPVIDTPILSNLFSACRVFNSPINNWDVSNVTEMRMLFVDAVAFNQPLDSWDTGNVTDMYAMFYSQARDYGFSNWQMAFDQDISNWDFTGLSSSQGLQYFGRGLNLSPSNYDALLISWQNQAASMPSNMVDVDLGISRYTAAAASARSALVNTYGWTITDGGAA